MQAASNHGIAESRSRFIVIHDDDDSWHPEFLARTVAYLEKASPGRRGVVAGTEVITERFRDGRFVELRRQPMALPADPIDTAALRKSNRFPPIAFLFEREAAQAIGNFRHDLAVLGDWDFNLRFSRHFAIGAIGETLAHWHHRSRLGSLPRRYANSSYLQHLADQMRLQREWGQIPDLWRYLMLWRY
jgi:glycosyltransferase involved in cell wall biosynthesis